MRRKNFKNILFGKRSIVYLGTTLIVITALFVKGKLTGTAIFDVVSAMLVIFMFGFLFRFFRQLWKARNENILDYNRKRANR